MSLTDGNCHPRMRRRTPSETLGGGMIAARRQLDEISPYPIPVTQLSNQGV